MASRVSLKQDDAIGPLREIAQQLTCQIDRLRTMHLEPGDSEPVDSSGRDLCGSVREMAHLCEELNCELNKMSKKIKKGRV